MVLSPAGFVMVVMMAVAGRSLGKFDPRLMVALGYIATAAGIYNLTRLDLNTAFGTVTVWRMLQGRLGCPSSLSPSARLTMWVCRWTRPIRSQAFRTLPVTWAAAWARRC